MTSQSTPLTDSRLANLGARLVTEAYEGFESRFRIVTRRARIRFAERDWAGMASDARERLRLYEAASRRTSETVRELLGERTDDRMVWAGMKAVYSGSIMGRPDWELAETFFNSVTRKIFAPLGSIPGSSSSTPTSTVPPLPPAPRFTAATGPYPFRIWCGPC